MSNVKRVKITLNERVFVICLQTTEDEEESVTLFKAFGEFALNDPYISKKISTHFAVFEHYDSEFDSMVELSCTKKLPTNEFVVRMRPLESPLKSSNDGVIVDQLCPSEAESPEGLEIEAVVLNATAEVPEDVIVMNKESVLVPVPKGRPSKALYTQHNYTIDNMPMPKFSKKVKDFIARGEILYKTMYLIQEAADHLLEIIPNPSPTTYSIFVAGLLIYVPELDPETDPAATNNHIPKEMIRKALVTRVRNVRQRRIIDDENRQRGSLITALAPQAAKRRLELDENADEGVLSCAVKEHTSFSEHDLWLRAKRLKPDALKTHLKSFSNERREKIKSCESMKDVIKMWPSYTNPELIKEEFFLMCGMSEDLAKQKFTCMVKTLGLIHDVPCETEHEKLLCLVKAEDYLSVNVSKCYPKAFTVVQLATPKAKTRLPNNVLANAPITVTYVAPDQRLTKCFVMFEATRLCTLENPTAQDIFLTLFGTYYSFDRSYPAISRNLYDFFDFSFFEKNNANPSIKLINFKKQYVQLLTSSSQAQENS